MKRTPAEKTTDLCAATTKRPGDTGASTKCPLGFAASCILSGTGRSGPKHARHPRTKPTHAGSATRLFRKLLRGVQDVPRVIVTYTLHSYSAAKRKILPGVEHLTCPR